MDTVFSSGRSALLIWVVALMLLACGAGMTLVGWWELTGFALDPANGGVLATVFNLLLVFGLLLLPGLATALVSLGYPFCYVTRIDANETRDEFRVRRLAGPSLTVRLDDVVTARFNDGRFQHVNAPWYTLRLRGRRLPLIVDFQGEFLDPAATGRLLADA